jgi:hypothetical protein
MKIFSQRKKDITWLSDLQKYVKSFLKQLNKKGFAQIFSQNGPGMGAIITYSNEIIEFDLINDKSQYFIEIRSKKHLNNSFGLAFLVSISELFQSNKKFTELTESEKLSLYKISYDHKDPLSFFFRHYNDILNVLDENNYEHTVIEVEDFLNERVKWLFPNLKT